MKATAAPSNPLPSRKHPPRPNNRRHRSRASRSPNSRPPSKPLPQNRRRHQPVTTRPPHKRRNEEEPTRGAPSTDRERQHERMSSVRDRTLSWQPPLWTVINFSIRESHELSGHESGHIPEKMEPPFPSGFLF